LGKYQQHNLTTTLGLALAGMKYFKLALWGNRLANDASISAMYVAIDACCTISFRHNLEVMMIVVTIKMANDVSGTSSF
jgi:hypothetical protein